MSKVILFAGGGSGGHISPGLAIAEKLREFESKVQTIFVCSQRSIDASMLREAGVEFVPAPATPPSLSPLRAARFVRNFSRSKSIVKRLIRDRNVEHVVAMGGFIAAPAVSAARAMGVQVVLVNLDSPPGKANRWMARRCDRVLSAIAIPSMPAFAEQIVGLPIRSRAIASLDLRQCRIRLGLDPEKPVLLVTGASQGATSINTLMAELARSQPQIFNGWQIYHLTGHGPSQLQPEMIAYKAAGIPAKVEAFLNDIGLAWGAADLAISRAGANSVAEVAANNVPTLFLPYPYHKDMHQQHNAQPLVDAGGAVMVKDQVDPAANCRTLAPVLAELMGSNSKRQQMRAALRSLPRNEAGATIARILLSQ